MDGSNDLDMIQCKSSATKVNCQTATPHLSFPIVSPHSELDRTSRKNGVRWNPYLNSLYKPTLVISRRNKYKSLRYDMHMNARDRKPATLMQIFSNYKLTFPTMVYHDWTLDFAYWKESELWKKFSKPVLVISNRRKSQCCQ